MAEKQVLYGLVTRLPKNDNEVGWKTTGYVGFNPEGTYQYEFSESIGWKQPVFTKLDWEFFQKKPDDYRCEAVSGRDARPQRPQRDETPAVVKPDIPSAPPIPQPEVMKPVEPRLAENEALVKRTPLGYVAKESRPRMGRPPKTETQPGA